LLNNTKIIKETAKLITDVLKAIYLDKIKLPLSFSKYDVFAIKNIPVKGINKRL
jgi:hypothetical protein